MAVLWRCVDLTWQKASQKRCVVKICENHSIRHAWHKLGTVPFQKHRLTMAECYVLKLFTSWTDSSKMQQTVAYFSTQKHSAHLSSCLAQRCEAMRAICIWQLWAQCSKSGLWQVSFVMFDSWSQRHFFCTAQRSTTEYIIVSGTWILCCAELHRGLRNVLQRSIPSSENLLDLRREDARLTLRVGSNTE